MNDSTPSTSTQRFRFEGFEFDASTGRLDSNETSTTLAPQPARLLTLLLEARGELVTHDTIRKTLWPDNTVEYDQGVHFCIRQIRTALGDSGTNPTFIKTLPRRGYAWIPPIEEQNPTTPEPTADAAPDPFRRRVLKLAGVLAVAVFIWGSIAHFTAPPPVRIAIMPFEPQVMLPDAPTGPSIATTVTAQLAQLLDLEVIGPTTTTSYSNDPSKMQRIVGELHVDFVLNARFAEQDDTTRMLVELIRAADGAHVWVHWFNIRANVTDAANTILDAIIPALREPQPDN